MGLLGGKKKKSKSPAPQQKREQTPPKKSKKPETPKKGKSAPAAAPAAARQEEEQFVGAIPEGSPLSKAEIANRIVCSREPQSLFELGITPNGVGVTLRYAYVSQRGYYPDDLYKANQDAFKISTKFNQSDKPQILLGVFDGHGGEGDRCSYFVRDKIEVELADQMKKQPKDFGKAYSAAFTSLGRKIHEQEEFDDSMSGTTAIAAFFHGTHVTIANIGDSRAMVGKKKKGKVVAHSLSVDQTPYRKDERERIKKAGGVVMSMDMLDGTIPFHENWGVNLGEETDDSGDPPRVWAPGQSYPGCAFTRSIGDAVGEELGVTPEPEISTLQLSERDEFIVLASDGVWEFLTNQSVCDMVASFSSPLDACRAVVSESYRLWLQFDERTDDITMITAYIDRDTTDAVLMNEDEDDAAMGGGVTGGAAGLGAAEMRPVRRGLSKEKKKAMAIMTKSASDPDEDLSSWVAEVIPKTEQEIERIERAVKANFLFQHLHEAQIKTVYDVMKRREVHAGDVVIRQGEEGDWFYVVDDGDFSVSIEQNGQSV
jgi:serine/threonine protein phosphatase PrpC